jgi:hypothetical protein
MHRVLVSAKEARASFLQHLLGPLYENLLEDFNTSEYEILQIMDRRNYHAGRINQLTTPPGHRTF